MKNKTFEVLPLEDLNISEDELNLIEYVWPNAIKGFWDNDLLVIATISPG